MTTHVSGVPACPPGYVLLPVKPEGMEREKLLRALEDAGRSQWAGTVQGAAGHLYDALVEAARGVIASDEQQRLGRESAAFDEWWVSSGHAADPSYNLTIENCARAAWHARARDVETGGEGQP